MAIFDIKRFSNKFQEKFSEKFSLTHFIRSKVLEQDVSAHRTAQDRIFKQLGIAPFNPDKLVGRKGLQIYRKMIRDESQIKAIQSLRKSARLSTGFDIVPADEKDKVSVMHADFIRMNFELMRGTPEKNIRAILSAFEYGYSITEMNFALIEDGEFNGKIRVDNMKTRNPLNYGLIDDDHGNLIGIEIKNEIFTQKDVITDLFKFIIYSHNKEFDNWYGESDLRAIYRNWWAKDILIKFWNMALERYGNPHYLGTFPDGTQKIEQDAFLDMLDNLQATSVAAIPASHSVTILKTDVKNLGFKEAITYHDKQMTRGLLTPALMLDEGDRSGSYALGSKQFDIFLLTLENMGKVIEDEIMGDQFIKTIIDINWPDVKQYPKFRFRSIEDTSQESKIELIKEMVATGVILPDEPWIREFVGIPSAESKGATLSDIVKVKKLREDAGCGDAIKDALTKHVHLQERAETNAQTKRADVKGIKTFFEKGEKTNVNKLGNIIRSNFKAVVAKVKKMDFTDIDTIDDFVKAEIDLPKSYERGVNKMMLDSFNRGRMDSRIEIKKGLKEFKATEIELTALEPAAALEWLDEYSEFLADIDNTNLRREVKQILFQGLKEGTSTDKVVDGVEDVFSKYIDTPSDRFKPSKLNTLVRTNMTLAYSQGRLAEMRDPDVRERIPAFRFSAVIDDRTTEICESLDGRIFNADDPSWDAWTPPNHFNCRSIMLPVFKGEEFDISKKSGIPEVPFGFGLTDKFIIPKSIMEMMVR